MNRGQITVGIATIFTAIAVFGGGLSAYFTSRIATNDRIQSTKEEIQEDRFGDIQRITAVETKVSSVEEDVSEIKEDVKSLLRAFNLEQ